MKKIRLLPLVMTFFLIVNIAFAADEIHWTITGQDSVTFDWRGTALENSIGYGLSPGVYTQITAQSPDPVPNSSQGPFWEAKLTGLKENTRYYYSIGNGPERTFHTAPYRGSSDFTIYAQGNIGDTTSYFNMGVIQDLIANDQPAFVIGLGDLTLGSNNGKAAVDQHFNDVMAWSKEAAYMPVWGDLDWRGSSTDSFNNYKGRFDVPNSQTSPGSPLAGGKDWYWFDYGNTRFITLPESWSGAWSAWNTKADALMAQAQADPDIKYIVTFAHQPAYSSGHYTGSASLRGMLDTLGDTHSKYVLNVNAHSNNYERSHPQHGVVHVTAGIGGANLQQDGSCLWLTCPQPSWSAYRAMHQGALKLHFTGSGIEGSFICGPAGGGSNDVNCTKGSVVDKFMIDSPTVAPSASNSVTSAVASAEPMMRASTSTTTNLLGNPGFESGATTWVQSGNVIGNSTSQPAHSGTWKAHLNGYGYVSTESLYQTVTIPATVTSATLSFWLRIDTAETTTTKVYDTLSVQVQNSSGTVLNTLATYSNLNKNTSYVQKSFDLSSYKGQTIRLSIKGTEDSSLKTSFVLDDFVLEGSDTPTTTPPPTSDTQAPTVPNGLVATVISSSQINLSWAASSDNVGVTGYKIFRNGSQVGTSSTTTYSDSGLSASTSYAYTVAAYDAAGNTSGNSTAGTATTPGTSGSAVQGFAAANGVTGGAGGQRIVVTNLNDTGPGSLRQAVQYTSGPRVVTFTPGLTGTITNASKNLHVQSNDLTLDGAGANITISGYSFNIYNSATLTATRNVIVKNLTFANTTAGVSAISIERGSNTVWIDHNTFVNNSSGSTGEPINIWNYTGAADTMTGITISWCRFNTYNTKVILVGSGEQTVKKKTRVSIHHNWFNGTTARNPFIHGGNLAHIWNNYIYAWKEHGIAGSSRADILAQNNIFENGANSNALVPSYNLPGALSADSANASGNLIIGNGVISTRGTFPMNQLTYSVTPEVADNALKNRIISGAGAHP